MALDINILKSLFKLHTGDYPNSIDVIPISGSNRRYYRLSNGIKTVLGVYNPVVKENEAYISFTNNFLKYDIPVPKVYEISDDKLYYLVEDLGDGSLYNEVLACNGSITGDVLNLYKKALKHLVKMQITAAATIDYNYSYPVKKFDARPIQWDLNYFKYNFLKLSGVQFDELLLQKDFDNLTEYLSDMPLGSFMFRDFQSRNIIIKDGEPYFIDFQGGMEGPKAYDVASLLYQAKAQIPDNVRKELFDYYYSELSKVVDVDYNQLYNSYRGFALQRTLQVLGAYGFRGYYERKPHFIQSIPYAINNLRSLLSNDNFPIPLPHIKEVADALIIPPQSENNKNDKLLVRVSSFSYKKGIPDDPSGNGGGFVFDCRGIHNPGRYEEYKQSTGRDANVIEFFKDTNIDEFVENVKKVTIPTIENYIERKFDSLCVNFGCTGGQHRSVYSAEAFAKYISNKYDISVVLWHREQDIIEEYD